MNAADLLTKRALLTPNREALVELASGVHYTYAELDQRSSRAANFLRDQYGVKKGDRVSILAHNNVAQVDLLFGLAKLGAILAPLNWRLTSRELTYIINDCQPKVLIVGPEFVPVYHEMKDSIQVEHLISIEGADVSGQAYESLLDQAAAGEPPCPPSLIQSWSEKKSVVMRQGYGLTEVGVNCFSMTDEDAVRKPGSVGKPIFHSEMRLVDADGNDVPQGQTGELISKGGHVCSGYWNNEEATNLALKDGWFHTGDMARMDQEGFFYIAGRFKDMIISGGENVYAAEVEAVFREHCAVADAALIGQPS